MKPGAAWPEKCWELFAVTEISSTKFHQPQNPIGNIGELWTAMETSFLRTSAWFVRLGIGTWKPWQNSMNWESAFYYPLEALLGALELENFLGKLEPWNLHKLEQPGRKLLWVRLLGLTLITRARMTGLAFVSEPGIQNPCWKGLILSISFKLAFWCNVVIKEIHSFYTQIGAQTHKKLQKKLQILWRDSWVTHSLGCGPAAGVSWILAVDGNFGHDINRKWRATATASGIVSRVTSRFVEWMGFFRILGKGAGSVSLSSDPEKHPALGAHQCPGAYLHTPPASATDMDWISWTVCPVENMEFHNQKEHLSFAWFVL